MVVVVVVLQQSSKLQSLTGGVQVDGQTDERIESDLK